MFYLCIFCVPSSQCHCLLWFHCSARAKTRNKPNPRIRAEVGQHSEHTQFGENWQEEKKFNKNADYVVFYPSSPQQASSELWFDMISPDV